MSARIQRRRTKGWRLPAGAVYVGRPSRWGNPFIVGETYLWLGSTTLPYPIGTHREPGVYDHNIRVERLTEPQIAVEWFRAWFTPQIDRPYYPYYGIAALRGHDLACWCPLCEAHRDGLPLGVVCPDCAPCHADVLLELAS